MIAKKNQYRFIVIIMIPFIAILILFYTIFGGNSSLKIKNLTDSTLSGINIKYLYSDNEKIIEIPDILPRNTYKMDLILPEDFTEGAVKVIYNDNFGIQQEDFLIGYIEKGYRKKTTMKVYSVNEDGKLLFQVQ